MSTTNDIIKNVKQNLGNRSSGVIGGTPVDTVCLNAVNKGIQNIVKMANPDYYNRIVTVDLITTTNIYVIPTTDIDGNTVKVKQITSGRLVRVGEYSAYRVSEVTMEEYLKYNEPNLDEPGIPSNFAYYQGKLYFLRYPEDNYTLTLAVNVFPQDIPAGDIDQPLAFDVMWDEVIECYATHYCFAKLQQMADSNYWFAKYQETKREAKGVLYKRPMQKHPNTLKTGSSMPEADPFVRRWNS